MILTSRISSRTTTAPIRHNSPQNNSPHHTTREKGKIKWNKKRIETAGTDAPFNSNRLNNNDVVDTIGYKTHLTTTDDLDGYAQRYQRRRQRRYQRRIKPSHRILRTHKFQSSHIFWCSPSWFWSNAVSFYIWSREIAVLCAMWRWMMRRKKCASINYAKRYEWKNERKKPNSDGTCDKRIWKKSGKFFDDDTSPRW